MKRRLLALLVTCMPFINACAETPQPARPPAVPGSDSDAHGCKASAGYAWCLRVGRCVRPWEIASEKGFSLDDRGFERYCSKSE